MATKAKRANEGAAIRKRIAGLRSKRQVRADAARVVEEREGLDTALAQAEEKGLPRQQRRAMERAREKLDARALRLLERNDEAVRRVLQQKGRITDVMSAAGPTDADELLHFALVELDLLSVFEALAVPDTRVDPESGEEKQRRMTYAPVVLNLLAVIGRFLGLTSGPELQAAILADERWMGLLGFNAQEVRDGASKRSVGLVGKTREGAGGKFVDAGPVGPARARIEGPRGALSAQTLAAHESDLPAQALATAFNAVVRRLAEKGFFGKRLRTALDTTGEEVVPSFEGAGVVRKKTKVVTKARRPRQVEVLIQGFKLWFLMDVETGFPMAMALDTIEKAENVHVRTLVDQAIENLEGHSEIVSMALDRGFLDGDLLSWLYRERHIRWVCPSKEKMDVTQEARERVSQTLARQQRQLPGAHGELRAEEPLETARRLARGNDIYEGVRFFERCKRENCETLVVAQVDDLTCTGFYGEGGSNSSRTHSKHFMPTPLHATVVLCWPDRSAIDREDEQAHDEPSRGPLVLLSADREGGLVRFDRYDERSLIENRLNRDGKQYFGLGRSLARNRAALWSATVFSTLALMLDRALRLHLEKAQEHLDLRQERLGVLRYRRQLELQNRDKILVTTETCYGIFPLREFARLAGGNLG
jgi:hypothetical protein